MTEEVIDTLATSAGHSLSNLEQLDGHYAVCQLEYEAMLRSVGLQPGWCVLDAGCGVGGFLPLLSQLVGSTGQIHAVDLAPENIALVQARQEAGVFACPIEAKVSTVSLLPFADDQFDAIWCANVTQYLTDAELGAMLAEFRRVLKPGGLLGLKEFTIMNWLYQPLDPLLMARLWLAQVEEGDAYTQQALRAIDLPAWVRQSGFQLVQANTVLIERRQPLRGIERAFFQGIFGFLASVAAGNGRLSSQDRATWQQLTNFASPAHILNHPDFYSQEGSLMIVAQSSAE
ncbi:MAG: methyltransferase domain-containing protein [Anaerolineales bacterium]|nr:methyltransferase domain-containing protein [Anaerolineales bacterium]